MPRKAQLVPHLTSNELKQRYRQSQDRVESRRWHLLWKVSLGWTLKNSALAVGINYDYAKEILKRYNQEGEPGVKNRKSPGHKTHRGRQSLLNAAQLQGLAQAVKSPPSDGGIWSGPKVARWIEKENGIERVWHQRGWDYLKKLGYSCQSPRPKHRKADPNQQAQFLQNWPAQVEALRGQSPEAEIDIWFFDEHRVGLKPILRKVWSPIRERPTAVVNHRYEWLYVYGFVKPQTGETLWYLIPRVNTAWLNLVYKTFAVDVGISASKKVLLVEDNAGWHRSDKVQVPEGINILYLPPYSPELQPAERLWQLVDEPLVNQDIESLDVLEERLVKRCQILMEMTTEIKKLTHYHWLETAPP